MTLSNPKFHVLAGAEMPKNTATTPFSDTACSFLDDLSQELLKSKEAQAHSDVIAFAFWCRKANIQKLKAEYQGDRERLGVGLAFHIAPSNVPINFAFSFVFGLLAGNSNLVRVPSKNFPQIKIVADAIQNVFKKHPELKEQNTFIKYEADEETTRYLSSIANARLIWGGDETIRSIQKHPLQIRGVDLTFGDRYAISVLDADAITRATEVELNKLAEQFYNDTYAMDQNACSSPSFVIWRGSQIQEAQQCFWSAMEKTAATKKYSLEPVLAVDKLFHLCMDAATLAAPQFTQQGINLYRVQLNALTKDMQNLRGSLGYFYEFNAKNLEDMIPLISSKCQTITYFGLDAQQIGRMILDHRLSGVDRVVPVGAALDIGLIWDGYDLIRSLSRIIEIR